MIVIDNNTKVAILGSGSWATALARIVLNNVSQITWYIRREEAMLEFQATGKNPGYLTAATFDVQRIHFTSDINEAIKDADVIVLAIPSPYVRQSIHKIHRSMRRKIILSAVKGMIPETNELITDYMHQHFDIPREQLAIVCGPCHAEEIALDRLSYLTVGCYDIEQAKQLCNLLKTSYVRSTPSFDVEGLEYSSVMKNIYAIAAGLCHSLRYGDNFQAVLMANAIQEIERFTNAISPKQRDIKASGYLGDVLVTAYSHFSRNRQFGHMIGMGYSVKSAQLEMQMIAEGYYGTKAIHLINQSLQVNIPIADAMYNILYERQSPTIVINALTEKLS